jgi:hypothetical protein
LKIVAVATAITFFKLLYAVKKQHAATGEVTMTKIGGTFKRSVNIMSNPHPPRDTTNVWNAH